MEQRKEEERLTEEQEVDKIVKERKGIEKGRSELVMRVFEKKICGGIIDDYRKKDAFVLWKVGYHEAGYEFREEMRHQAREVREKALCLARK
jgi:hypothetical protein